MARLQRLSDETGREISVDDAVVTIGRAGDNDVVIDLTEVSRAHARLEREAGTWRLVDLGSTNGTAIDITSLRPWQPHPLEHGSVIDLGGGAQYRFLLDPEEIEPSEPTVRRVVERSVRLTPAETEVLELLFMHYDSGRATPRLATVKEVAEARFTSAAAVKMMLQQLYDKFELVGTAERNKETLAVRAQEWRVTRRRA